MRAAVRECPHDRELRRVYADWLLELGEARGEWLALTCNSDETSERRAHAHWQRHEAQWRVDDN